MTRVLLGMLLLALLACGGPPVEQAPSPSPSPQPATPAGLAPEADAGDGMPGAPGHAAQQPPKAK